MKVPLLAFKIVFSSLHCHELVRESLERSRMALNKKCVHIVTSSHDDVEVDDVVLASGC